MATFSCRVQYLDDRDPFANTNFPEPTRPPIYSFLDDVPLINQIASIHRLLQAPHQLEDCALQLYRNQSGTQGEYGVYLDLESTLDEQAEELEGFTDQKKNAIILRTQLTVRVQSIIEKLLTSNGRELRRALFSLKQIFQDDKDLVHEFVNNDGLTCMVKVGSESDQNYQNYILRALGQVMLYVDGMEGLIKHNATVQWLYSLLASKVRLVVKTALKLLLVFVEYTESNTVQLISAIETVDSRRGLHPWTNVMALLNEKDGADSELLIYTMTLINKVISAIADQDTFYDLTDALEELGMDAVTHRLMNKQGADLDLLTQFQLYESALKHEDGDDYSVISQVENLRRVPRKKSESHARKSKRHEGGQEMTLPDYSPSQAQAADMPAEAVRRKDGKRESFGELQVADNESLSQRSHLHAVEKMSPTSQRKSVSPQNARNRRMSRQRIFMEEKHELLAVVDKQDQNQKEPQMASSEERNLESRLKPGQSFPTPFVQTQTPFNTHGQMQYLPQSSSASTLPNTRSSDTSLSTLPNTRSSDTSLSSTYGSGESVSQAELILAPRTSYDYNRAQNAVSRQLHNSFNSYQNDKYEAPQKGSEFGTDQKVPDSSQSASSVSYLSGSASVQSSKSTNSVSFSPQQFGSLAQEVTPMDIHLNASRHPNLHQQPHHPHFHNHYHDHSHDYGAQPGYKVEYQGYVILNNDQSFTPGGTFSSTGPPINEFRQPSFDDVPKVNLNQHSVPARGDSQLPGSNVFSDKQGDSAAVYSNQREGMYSQSQQSDYMTSQSQQMVENGFLGTREGQVRNMQSRLKSGVEGPKEAMRPVGDVSGIISNARNNLSRLPTSSNKLPPVVPVIEMEKKAESDFQWDRIQRRLNRQLKIKDMDFSDLRDEDDVDIFSSVIFDSSAGSGVPPPPPPPPACGLPPPPAPAFGDLPPPPPPLNSLSPSPQVGGRYGSQKFFSSLPPPPGAELKKSKKTLRLHWRALPGDSSHPATKGEVIWKHLVPVSIDTNKLEHLFETRTSELKSKKQDGSVKKEITVLDTKRSNAINIGLTVLPPARTIKAAILKMDNSIMSKEGIEKILKTMIPSEEEKAKIMEAQMANPDIPLGTAEQFLLTLSSISELEARLKLWQFKLDYELSEQEVAEPLMDLKKGIVELRRNKTFKCILSAVLTIGNFLNGAAVHAFNVEFLQRLPEIKDTVRKQSLIHHLSTLIIEQFPDTTDLYSEIGPVTRCSRVDWDELSHKLNKMENDCKASWDYLQSIIKHDGSTSDLKGKMSTFLADAAERIMILNIIFKRIMNRYNKMLLFLGLPASEARDMKVNHFCKVISEFALEYRTTRDKVLQMMQKKANQRERKKTRGKMIVDTENFRSKKPANDDALKQILKNGYTGTDELSLTGQRGRRRPMADVKSVNTIKGGSATDSDMFDTGDDEILEACVRSAAAAPSSRAPRERRRARTQRKSLRRTLKGGLSFEEQQAVETYDDHV